MQYMIPNGVTLFFIFAIKCMFISGHGKTHRDAASVQATHPIPAACGLYYFEVKIVSKGRDGYMGIGLSAHGVNMNRLPGTIKTLTHKQYQIFYLIIYCTVICCDLLSF